MNAGTEERQAEPSGADGVDLAGTVVVTTGVGRARVIGALRAASLNHNAVVMMRG